MTHLAALALVASAAPATAQSCDGTTADMIECAMRVFEQADTNLNAIYKQVMAQAKAGGYDTELRQAQRLWIPYRDAACEAAAAAYKGGSIQPLIRIGCLTDLTEHRTQELRAMTLN